MQKFKKKYCFFGIFFQRIIIIMNVLEGTEDGFLKRMTATSRPHVLTILKSRSFENSYIPENPRTPKPLTFSKNRLRGAKNRSNISPVAKKFFRKNDFFFSKNFAYVQTFFLCICAQSLYNTYLKRFVKKNLKKKTEKKKLHICTKNKKKLHICKRFRSRFFERNNGLGDIGNWGSSRVLIDRFRLCWAANPFHFVQLNSVPDPGPLGYDIREQGEIKNELFCDGEIENEALPSWRSEAIGRRLSYSCSKTALIGYIDKNGAKTVNDLNGNQFNFGLSLHSLFSHNNNIFIFQASSRAKYHHFFKPIHGLKQTWNHLYCPRAHWRIYPSNVPIVLAKP
ncbi:hypothetical protein LXL04_023984 [Taraxacum kok-saghyz]